MKSKERIKARIPVEKELRKMEKRYGVDLVLSALNRFSLVARTRKRNTKRINELNRELDKLRG